MRVYIQDKKERLVKKMLDAYNSFNEAREKDAGREWGGKLGCFRHVLILVVQCKFEEAIMFINNTALSMTSQARDPKAVSVIDRLLVICNILTSIYSSKGDLQLIENNLMQQLNYYKWPPLLEFTSRKGVTPVMFKILQFLLLYIRYNTDTNYNRIREQNDRAILDYLKDTNDGSFLAFEDLLVALRYLSTAAMMEYCECVEEE